PQVRQCHLAGREDADEVQLQEVSELFDRELVNRLVGRVPAGVINKTVNAAVARGRGLDEVAYVVLPPHVAEDEGGTARPAFARERLKRALGRRALGLGVRADDDLRARAYEHFRATPPDAAAAAGDDYDPVRVTQTVHSRPPACVTRRLRLRVGEPRPIHAYFIIAV